MTGEQSGDGAATMARQAGESEIAGTQATGGRADATATAGRPGTIWRRRLLWVGATVLAAVLLFIGLLRISWTYWVNSDGSGVALQGWDMLHGNLLLSGWWTADVSFYTFETPIDAVVEAIRGLGTGVVHITAAIAYTLLVCVGALLARGKSRGPAGVAAALLAGGILLAPGDSVSTGLLLGSPDHIGIAVPIMLTLLLVDRAPERWWVPPLACVLLVWAQLDDPVAEFAAAFALAVVCLVRAGLGLMRRGHGWRYDAALGAAAVVSYGLTRLAVRLIRDAGGLSMRQLQQAEKIQPVSHWPRQLLTAGHNTLALFGADYFHQPSKLLTAAAAVHFIGAVLAAIGVIAGIVSLVRRRGDRVTQALTIGTLVTLGAGAFATAMTSGYDAHQIAVVVPFSAVLAGRTIGPWLVRRRIRLALIPAGSVLLAAYLAFFGYFATGKSVPARTQTLDNWLVAHHMTDGLGRYWAASSTRLVTGDKVRISPVDPSPNRPYPWVTKPSWYDPGAHTANFVVAGTDPQAGLVFSESAVTKAFGKPAREYRFSQFIIMVYDKNLLRELDKPVQPHPDTGSFHL